MDLRILISQDEKVFKIAEKIRNDVFVNEQGFENEFDEIDKIAFHSAVFDGGKAIGCARMFLEQRSVHIGRIAVITGCRKMGVGAFIVKELENFALSAFDFDEFVLSAQLRAYKFYEKMGYKKRGEVYLDEFCEHIDMYKENPRRLTQRQAVGT